MAVTLAELLLNKADLKKQRDEAAAVVMDNIQIQEGDVAEEDTGELLDNYYKLCDELYKVTVKISKLNNTNAFEDDKSMTDILIYRSSLKQQINYFESFVREAQSKPNRRTVTEIKYINTISPSTLREKLKALKTELREIDVKIQKRNWEIQEDD